MLFKELESLDWQGCARQYARVEQQIDKLTQDGARRSAIYRILWQHGGRCDCTTAFNIVKQPEVRTTVEREIESLLARA
jgi:hypothetical protein